MQGIPLLSRPLAVIIKGYLLQQALSLSISFAAPTQVTMKCLSPLISTYLNTNQPSPPILPRQRQSGYIASGA